MSFVWALIRPFIPQMLIGALILGAVAWIDHNGYQRAERAAIAREAKAEKAAQDRQAELQKQITDAIAAIDADNAKRLADIDATRKVVQPIIQKEIASDPRYSNPAQGISPAMLDALNKARGESNK